MPTLQDTLEMPSGQDSPPSEQESPIVPIQDTLESSSRQELPIVPFQDRQESSPRHESPIIQLQDTQESSSGQELESPIVLNRIGRSRPLGMSHQLFHSWTSRSHPLGWSYPLRQESPIVPFQDRQELFPSSGHESPIIPLRDTQ